MSAIAADETRQVDTSGASDEGRRTVVGPVEIAPAGRAGIPTAHVRVGSFDGPLSLFLALIEARELDVLSVPLGDLAEAYLEAVARLAEGRMASLSGFVSLAAQLILIKSRALLPGAPEAPALPTGDESDPEEELRRRLLAYRAFRDAAGRLAERLEAAGDGLFHRETAVALSSARAAAESLAGRDTGRHAGGEPLDPHLLAEALAWLARVALPAPPVPETVARTITIEERAAAIREALRSAPAIVLQELLRGVHDRVVAAVTFLAMLELVKGHEIIIEQHEPWGAITCRRLG